MLSQLLSEVFDVEVDEFSCRRGGSVTRSVGARMLCRYGGLSQREAGRVRGVGTGAAVSRQLTGLSDRLKEDRKLARLVRKAEIILQALQSR